MNEPQEIAEHLVQLVDTSAERRVTGVVLGAALRLKYPHFRPDEYGAVNLKKFIETYASDRLQVAGRSGLDVVYTICDSFQREQSAQPMGSSDEQLQIETPEIETSSEDKPAPLAEENAIAGRMAPGTPPAPHDRPIWFPKNVWMAFSSVTNKARVLANRDTGEVTADESVDLSLHRDDRSWVTIPPLTRQDHIEMAREFESTLAPEIRADVGPLIGTPGKWWAGFQIRLSSKSPADAAKWKLYHNSRTQQKLLAALRNAGVATEKVTAFVHDRGRLEWAPGQAPSVRENISAAVAGAQSGKAPDALRSLAALLTSLGSLINDLSNRQM